MLSIKTNIENICMICGNSSCLSIFYRNDEGESESTCITTSEKYREYYPNIRYFPDYIKMINSLKRENDRVYIVALICGGLMEDPDMRFENFNVVIAKDSDDARKIYNEVNKCSFYYGHVLGEVEFSF